MRKPVEIIEGEKSLRLNFYIFIASYILLILLIEPIIDSLLPFLFKEKSYAVFEQLNKLKILISAISYTGLGMIPAIFAAWFGYRVVASSKLPPVLLSGKTRFPFTVVVIKGRIAKMFGILIIIVSLVLIFQLIMYLVNTFIYNAA